jgi:hypothetical protein
MRVLGMRRISTAQLLRWSLVLILLTLETWVNVVCAQEEAAIGLQEQGAEAVVVDGQQVGAEAPIAGAVAIARAATAKTEKPKAEESGSESGDHSEYLYEEDAGPVIEYKANATENTTQPDFLFSTNNGPRMVEFYAWWYVRTFHGGGYIMAFE